MKDLEVWTSVISVAMACLIIPQRAEPQSFRYVESPVLADPLSSRQVRPHISGDIVVWEDWRESSPGVWEIDVAFKNLVTGEESIVQRPGVQYFPKVSGNRILFAEDVGDCSIVGTFLTNLYVYDIFQRVVTLAATGSFTTDFDISGDKIVFDDDGTAGSCVIYGQLDVLVRDLVTNQQTNISSAPSVDDGFPEIEGDYVIWKKYRDPDNPDVVEYNLSTGTPGNSRRMGDRIIGWEETTYDFGVSSTGAVVYTDDPDGDDWWDIYYREVGRPAVKLTMDAPPNDSDQTSPEISGNKAVWSSDGFIVLHDLISGVETTLSSPSQWANYPRIDGERVVWEDDNTRAIYWARRDLYPLAPTGLVAAGGLEQVSLDWNDNHESEQDLAAYVVYRSNTFGGPYEPIGMTTQSNYVDNHFPALDVTYYYRVKAVDMNNGESMFSSQASGKLIQGGGVGIPTGKRNLPRTPL